jgi:hypothetical protein
MGVSVLSGFGLVLPPFLSCLIFFFFFFLDPGYTKDPLFSACEDLLSKDSPFYACKNVSILSRKDGDFGTEPSVCYYYIIRDDFRKFERRSNRRVIIPEGHGLMDMDIETEMDVSSFWATHS